MNAVTVYDFMRDCAHDVETLSEFADRVVDIDDAQLIIEDASRLLEMFAVVNAQNVVIECVSLAHDVTTSHVFESYIVTIAIAHDFVSDVRAQFDATIFSALQFETYAECLEFLAYMLESHTSS